MGEVLDGRARFRAAAEAAEAKIDFNATYDGYIPECYRDDVVVEFRRTEHGIQRLEYPLEHLSAMLLEPVYTYPEPGTVVTTIATDNWPLDPFQD